LKYELGCYTTYGTGDHGRDLCYKGSIESPTSKKNVVVPSTALGEEVVSNVLLIAELGVETLSILMSGFDSKVMTIVLLARCTFDKNMLSPPPYT